MRRPSGHDSLRPTPRQALPQALDGICQETVTVQKDAGLEGHVDEGKTCRLRLGGCPDDWREAGVDPFPAGAFQPGRHPCLNRGELLRRSNSGGRQGVDHQEEVNVGVGSRTVAGHRPEHGQAHQTAAVDLAASLSEADEKVRKDGAV